jgi:hypothetical protein
MALERDEQGRTIIRLDGSLGLGPLARLSVHTTDKINGPVTNVFEVPYAVIDYKVLQKASDNNYILGYGVEKIMPTDEPPVQFTIGSPTEEGQ